MSSRVQNNTEQIFTDVSSENRQSTRTDTESENVQTEGNYVQTETTSSTTKTRKSPKMNPIDDTFSFLGEKLQSVFGSMNYGKEGIVGLSWIFAGAGLYSLYEKDLMMFTVYILLSHLLSVTNELYTKNNSTDFEFYRKMDRMKDIIVLMATFYVMFGCFDIMSFPLVLVVLSVMLVLTMLSLDGEDKCRRTTTAAGTVDEVTRGDKCDIHYNHLRWFSSGSFLVAVLAIIWYLKSASCNDWDSRMRTSEIDDEDELRDNLLFTRSKMQSQLSQSPVEFVRNNNDPSGQPNVVEMQIFGDLQDLMQSQPNDLSDTIFNVLNMQNNSTYPSSMR